MKLINVFVNTKTGCVLFVTYKDWSLRMNELISYEPGITGETYAISFVKLVKLNLVDASKAFFEIGFRLKEAQENKYYEENRE